MWSLTSYKDTLHFVYSFDDDVLKWNKQMWAAPLTFFLFFYSTTGSILWQTARIKMEGIGDQQFSDLWAPTSLCGRQPTGLKWCKTTLLRFFGVLKCTKRLHNLASLQCGWAHRQDFGFLMSQLHTDPLKKKAEVFFSHRLFEPVALLKHADFSQ